MKRPTTLDTGLNCSEEIRHSRQDCFTVSRETLDADYSVRNVKGDNGQGDGDGRDARRGQSRSPSTSSSSSVTPTTFQTRSTAAGVERAQQSGMEAFNGFKAHGRTQNGVLSQRPRPLVSGRSGKSGENHGDPPKNATSGHKSTRERERFLLSSFPLIFFRVLLFFFPFSRPLSSNQKRRENDRPAATQGRRRREKRSLSLSLTVGSLLWVSG